MIKTGFADTKQHYEILDGLRGVAAIIVIAFHILEIFSGGDHSKQIINHGYLAVDFFFMLSGFVIAHAYDDRWNKMSIGQFFKRRLIRLHPMIIVGMTIGAICFYAGASPILFPPISSTPVWKLILIWLIGCTLIPITVPMDIRGWQEMHPLDGPAWSLFFEYIANILYALFLRKVSKTLLSILVVITGIWLAYATITSPNGDIIGGWSLTGEQLEIGFRRLLYPFLMGLLLSRVYKKKHISHGFFLCSLLIVVCLAMPRIGGHEHLWMNGLYESGTILLVFPIIVLIGASGRIENKTTSKICTFLGNISYPVYIVHYPFIYIFSAWVVDNKLSLVQAWPVGLLLLAGVLVLAYLGLKLYDIPVRKWLSKKLLYKK